MFESRRELVDRFVTFMNEASDVNARVVAEQLLTAAIHTIWIRHPFRSFLVPQPYKFSTAAGTREYVLPPWFGRVAGRDRRIQNFTTGRRISPIEGEDLYNAAPSTGTTVDTATGQPDRYMIAGTLGLSAQLPAAGIALEALSDSATDTDVQVVFEGIDANGNYNNAAVTLTGTVAVAIGAGAWTAGPSTFSKSWPQTVTAPTSAQTLSGASAYTSSRGTVKLRSAADHATVYQTLLPHESVREQWVLTLDRTPDGVYSIGVPTLRLPRRLLNDADPVPTMWGPAVFEEMQRQWLLNTGELSAAEAAGLSMPRFIDLVTWDNELRSGGRSFTEPFR